MSPKSSRSTINWKIAVLVIGVAIALPVYQEYYMRKHRPLIAAGLAAAQDEGPDLFESEIGAPPGATPISERETYVGPGTSRGMWRFTPKVVSYKRAWDAPETHQEIHAWYQSRLLASGWRPWDVPSGVQWTFWKEKWLLTLERDAAFTGPEPHARFTLRLEWEYFHDLALNAVDPNGQSVSMTQ
jgi:hypothetical protein